MMGIASLVLVLCLGQTGAPPGLVVRGYGITIVKKRELVHEPATMEVDPASTHPQDGGAGWPARTVLKTITRPEAYLHVSNTGSRRITRIRWTLVYYDDEGHQHQRSQLSFDERVRIVPGATKFISVRTRAAAPTAFCDARIERLEYDDGRGWEPAEPSRGSASGGQTP